MDSNVVLKDSECEACGKPRPHPRKAPVYVDHRPTEEQVCMCATIPHHIDDHGSMIEDLAGTGEIDGFGG